MPDPQPGDIVLLISPDHKRFLIRLQPGERLHTHRGYIEHDEVLAGPLGRVVLSHSGQRFLCLKPSMEEVLMNLRRGSQIVYPKDAGYILLKLNIAPGTRLIEAGTGSGVLTAAFARYVIPGGHVYSYDIREDMLNLAGHNVERLGLQGAVTFHLGTIADGFQQTQVDAVFFDLREPWLYLEQAATAMANGAFFGALVPTINQVIALDTALHRRADFTDVEICELLLRLYKTTPERVRPRDRLTAHTGYLIFARKLS